MMDLCTNYWSTKCGLCSSSHSSFWSPQAMPHHRFSFILSLFVLQGIISCPEYNQSYSHTWQISSLQISAISMGYIAWILCCPSIVPDLSITSFWWDLKAEEKFLFRCSYTDLILTITSFELWSSCTQRLFWRLSEKWRFPIIAINLLQLLSLPKIDIWMMGSVD